MIKKILPFLILALLILPLLSITAISSLENIKSNLEWETPDACSSEFTLWDETGAILGPDLWHLTTFDSWSGDSCMACFNPDNMHYVNNMYINYLLSPTINMENIEDMIMDFYCKYITEDNDDHWGIVLFDPVTHNFLPHTYDALETWQQLPYETYGYHADWIGPMQPMGIYETFNIKDAYDNWINLGYFRNPDGSLSYELKIGFMIYETDEAGYTNPTAEVHGDYWSGLLIDDIIIQQVVFDDNEPPLTPGTPTGPMEGITSVSYQFSTSSIDPNGDSIKYGWDWNGDSIIDEWTPFYSSGATTTASHSWNSEGTYTIKVKAEDELGVQSDFSLAKTFVISANSPPNKPSLTGPSSGKTGNSYSYSASVVDPNDDQVYFKFDWDDGTQTDWIGPYNSEQTATASHVWNSDGSYSIKVKSKDVHGLEGVWSEPLSISMPKNKQFNQLFIRILEKHEFIFSILKMILIK